MLYYRRSKKLLLFMLPMVSILFGLMPAKTLARQSTSQKTVYKGIDVVFLIDQSGSMGGKDYGAVASEGKSVPPPNDPLDLRFQAVQFGIDWLGNFRAEQAKLGNPLDINVAMVNFGGINSLQNIKTADAITKISLDWTPINPDSPLSWKDKRDDILKAASAESFGKRNLGSTDFLTGFDRVFELFQDKVTTERRQIIVLLTDGAPCAPSANGLTDGYKRFTDPNCNSKTDKANHMTYVEQQINANFTKENQSLFVVGLDAQDSFWSQFGSSWEQIAKDTAHGRAERIKDSSEVGVAFNRILTTASQELVEDSDVVKLGMPVPLPKPTTGQKKIGIEAGKQSFPVPPYQQLMSVWLFKSIDTSRLQIYPPGKTEPLKASEFVTSGSTNGDAIETWQIPSPAPGQWTFGTVDTDDNQFADPGANISVDLVRAIFSFEPPKSTVPQWLPVNVALRVTDADGKLLPAYPDSGYELASWVTVMSPKKQPLKLDLKRTPTEKNSVYSASFTPQEAGEYQLTVDADAGTGSQEIKFSKQDDVVNVNPTVVEVQGFPKETLEKLPQKYVLQFKSNGDVLSNITVKEFTITMVPKGTECSKATSGVNADKTEKFEDFTTDASSVFIQAAHTKIGEQNVCVNVVIHDPISNIDITALDNQQYSNTVVNVIASQPLALKLLKPVERLPQKPEAISQPEFETMDFQLSPLPAIPSLRILPVWSSKPMQISVQIADKAELNKAVNIIDNSTQTTNVSPDNFLTLRLLDSNKNDIAKAQNIHLSPTGDPTIWSVTFNPPPPGQYTIQVAAASGRIGESTRVFLPDDALLSIPLVIEANGTVLNVQRALFVGAVALALLLVYSLILHPILVRLNPVRGQLAIVRRTAHGTEEVVGGPYELARFRRNSAELKLSQLPLLRPPLVGLRMRSKGAGGLTITYNLNGQEKETEVLVGQSKPIEWKDQEGGQYYFVKDRPQRNEESP